MIEMSELLPFEKPFSQACENNKQAIATLLKKALVDTRHVLEVGSGTGQHAVYFARQLPHLMWHCSDVEDYHQGINQWIDEYPSENLMRPQTLKLSRDEWLQQTPTGQPFDGVFTANTAHIMLKHEIKLLMQSINSHLPNQGVFCQYGPFKVDGKFTSQSNAEFHNKLIDSGRGGYRDLDELRFWAPDLALVSITNMPAHNLMLTWRKKCL